MVISSIRNLMKERINLLFLSKKEYEAEWDQILPLKFLQTRKVCLYEMKLMGTDFFDS